MFNRHDRMARHERRLRRHFEAHGLRWQHPADRDEWLKAHHAFHELRWHRYSLHRRFRHSLGARLAFIFLLLGGAGGLLVYQTVQQHLGWGWMLAGLWLITLLAYGSIRRMLWPLRALSHGAAAFGRGELSHRIRVFHRDEIGDVADRFNQMADDIQAMLDAKRELLLSISHELRSPLTRARLNAELMDEGPSQQAVVKELGEMRDLIEDLLERERLDSGHSALRLEEAHWPALVDELLQRRFAGAMSGGQLRADLADGLPAMRLDITRVQVLLGNLLDNALRHHDAAQGPVVLTVAESETGGVRLTVRDRGPGVPDDALPKLGQPFFRPDSARTRGSGGVGLGLSLCKQIAQAHGGTLTLRNAQPGLEAGVELPVNVKG
ncbi:sensor histidine kinase [Aquabacterium sp.]|uniref:sensor histidine kinase n=1 Tax=Aquabacterium sp. TaxID=1872578 RepID=UPI003D6D7C16